jgi:hypothetical protein
MSKNLISTIDAHVDYFGVVWSAMAGQPMQSTDMGVAEFVISLLHPVRVRLLGAAENSSLIVALYNRGILVRIASPQSWLQQGDPLLIPDLSDAACSVAASLGGWHAMRHIDFVGYALCENMLRPRVDFDSVSVVTQHPAWAGVSFSSSVAAEHFGRLVGLIRDPRWFVHAEHPNRLSKLECFLGLNPKRLEAIYSRRLSGPPSVRQARAVATFRAWWGGHPTASAVDLSDPRNFLFNALAGYLNSGVKLGVALFKTTRLFLKFVVGVWLNEAAKKTPHYNHVFVPELFFPAPGAAAAYRSWRSAHVQ